MNRERDRRKRLINESKQKEKKIERKRLINESEQKEKRKKIERKSKLV